MQSYHVYVLVNNLFKGSHAPFESAKCSGFNCHTTTNEVLSVDFDRRTTLFAELVVYMKENRRLVGNSSYIAIISV